MAVTRNNLSMKMNGRVGAFSYYTSTGGRQVARIANNSSNYGETAKRTVAMQTRRSRWGNLVSFYSANKDLMARAYERKGANLSDYNRFMQLNIPIATVSLIKDDFMRGMAILQEYIVSDGSLPEIDVAEIEEEGMTFNLLSSLDGNFSDYTIGQVSIDLLDNNPQLQEGDQLTFITWYNSGATPSTIRIYRQLCEMTIDSHSAVSFGSLPFAGIVMGNGLKVAIAGHGDVFGQVIIHSRSVGGNLFVSRSTIKLNNTTMVEQFSASDAVKKAIASYGVDAEKLLEPGSPAQPSPAPMPKLVTISVVNVPSAGGSVSIRRSDTEETATDVMSVPVGTEISLSYVSNEGFTWESYSPPYQDGVPFVVTSDVTITSTYKQTT